MDSDLSDPSADLAFIRKTMNDARGAVEVNGFFYVLWGSLCVLGTGLGYLEAWLGAAYLIPWTWGAISIAGAAASVVAGRRLRSANKTYAGALMGLVWLAALLAGAFFAGGRVVSGSLQIAGFMACMSVTIALGYFLSAIVARSLVLGILSIPWWIGGLAIGLLPDLWAPLALGSLTLLFELAPGIVLVARRKGAHDGSEA